MVGLCFTHDYTEIVGLYCSTVYTEMVGQYFNTVLIQSFMWKRLFWYFFKYFLQVNYITIYFNICFDQFLHFNVYNYFLCNYVFITISVSNLISYSHLPKLCLYYTLSSSHYVYIIKTVPFLCLYHTSYSHLLSLWLADLSMCLMRDHYVYILYKFFL
jgi:hypothetical protein